MNTRRTYLYMEGAGKGESAQRGEYVQAMSRLLDSAGVSRRPRAVVCHGRREAYDRFCTGLAQGQNAYLLVDAEAVVQQTLSVSEKNGKEQVVGADPWAHVLQRPGDRWARPQGATDEHLHLMTVTMETWLLSDPDALEGVFKKLDRSKLPAAAIDLERVSKQRVYDVLEKATKQTKAGPYGKGSHSFKVLALVSPTRLCTLLWARRFLDQMRSL